MTHDDSIAEQTYGLLRAVLLSGRLDPRARLDFAALATRFGVSTTPVREAAMRLLGEGLLELHHRAGLRPVFASEHRLRGMLEYHGRLAALAVDWAPSPVTFEPPDPTGSNEQRTRALFRILAEASANAEFCATVEHLADRLAPYRHVETPLLGDIGREYERLGAAIFHSAAGAKRQLRMYHLRRLKVVPQLVWLAASTSQADLGTA